MTPIHKFHEFDGTWRNNLPNVGVLTNKDTKQPLRWKDLNWPNKDNCLKKNKDFSISFWFFQTAENPTDWTELFNVYKGGENWWWYDRMPGVFLWPQTTSLHIRSNLDGKSSECSNLDGKSSECWGKGGMIQSANMGNDDDWTNWAKEEHSNMLPKLQSCFVIISFSSNGYTLYVNDNAPVEYNGLPNPPVDLDENSYFRSTYFYKSWRENRIIFNKTFCMKDLSIYDHILSTKEAQCIYGYNKANSDMCGAKKYLGLSTAGCTTTESFTTLTSWMYSYNIESFENYSFDMGREMLSFDSLVIISDINPQDFDRQTYDTTLASQMFNDGKARNLKYKKFDREKKQYIKVPHSIFYGSEGVTFCLWYKADIDKNWQWTRLFDFGNGPGENNIICAFLNNSLQFYSIKDWNPRDYANWQIIMAADSNWHHLAWSLHPTNGWRIYMNSTLVATLTDKTYPVIANMITDKVRVAQHYNFEGWVKEFGFTDSITHIDIPDVSNYTYNGVKSEMIGISSIEIPKGITVTWYDQTNFRGSSKTRTGYYKNNGMAKGPTGWNDRIKSLRIYLSGSLPPIERKNQYIGKSNWWWDDYYHGGIGDMRIYNKELNQQEITDIFNRPNDLPPIEIDEGED